MPSIGLLRGLRAERRSLPQLWPFLPLLLRRACAGLEDPIAAEAAAQAPGSVVLQLQPANAPETVALARGCRRGGARLVVHWPHQAPRDAFVAWHRTVIASGLLAHVEVVSDAEPFRRDAALVHGAA